MKTLLWIGSVMRADPEEREARRPLGRDPKAYSAMLAEWEKLTIKAEELGFDSMGCTEHHLQTEGGETMPNSLLLFAKLAGLTKHISFTTLSMVLPTHDPIRMAEDLALFDHLYPGRLQVAFARGYQSRWMQTLSQSDKIVSTPMDRESDAANRARYDEFFEILEKAWNEDAWSHSGQYYQAPYPATGIKGWPLADWTRRYGSPGEVDQDGTVRKIGVVPKPRAPLPMFVPAVVSRQTLIDAARRGHTALIFAGHKDKFRESCELYRDEARAAGYDVGLGERVGAVRKVFVGDSYAEAFELAVKYLGYWYNNFFGKFGFNEALRIDADDPSGLVAFDTDRKLVQRMVDVGSLICGTPDDVRTQMSDLSKCHSDGKLDWLVWEFWGQGAAGDHESAIPTRQLEMYAEHIIPLLGD